MTCSKCRGHAVNDTPIVIGSRVMRMYRCINCGDRWDAVVQRNRELMATRAAEKQRNAAPTYSMASLLASLKTNPIAQSLTSDHPLPDEEDDGTEATD